MSGFTAPKIPPPVMVLAAVASQRYMTRGSSGSLPAKVLAVGLGALGVGLVARARAALHAAHTTANPMRPESVTALVTTGVFEASRNPMYLGMVCLLTGHGFWCGSIRALLPPVAVACWLDGVQIPAEEAALEAKYGEFFRRYREHVPRWFELPRSLVWFFDREPYVHVDESGPAQSEPLS